MMIVAGVTVHGMAVLAVSSRRCGMAGMLMRCCWFRVVMAVRVIHFALLSGVKMKQVSTQKCSKSLPNKGFGGIV
jgi:hypothetical protein